jgi:predicted nuclease of predicted toxin-antitoxin system
VKVKLDENIPHTVCQRLALLGVDADSVLDERLGGRPDADVWGAAQAEERFFVTQDLDFSDRQKFSPGTHHGLLLVRLPGAEQWRIGDYVVAWLSSPDAATWQRCFVVATPTKVRVTRPPSDPGRSAAG